MGGLACGRFHLVSLVCVVRCVLTLLLIGTGIHVNFLVDVVGCCFFPCFCLQLRAYHKTIHIVTLFMIVGHMLADGVMGFAFVVIVTALMQCILQTKDSFLAPFISLCVLFHS